MGILFRVFDCDETVSTIKRSGECGWRSQQRTSSNSNKWRTDYIEIRILIQNNRCVISMPGCEPFKQTSNEYGSGKDKWMLVMTAKWTQNPASFVTWLLLLMRLLVSNPGSVPWLLVSQSGTLSTNAKCWIFFQI